MEFDDTKHQRRCGAASCGISFVQKNKRWVIKVVDRGTRRTVAWTGHRDARTFKRLYDKVKHLQHCHFYTDGWDAFTKILPPECHTISKSHTVTIERDNSNTRHHLGRMTRRTKVVSKKEEMLYGSIKLWIALTTPEIFSQYSGDLHLSLTSARRKL